MNIIRPLLHSFSEKYLNLIIQLLTSVVVARLLTPEDFGIYAISFFILLLANIIRQSGISSYIVKEKELSQSKLDTCFFILIAVSTSTFIGILSLSSVIAGYYEEPKLKLVLNILAFNILISSFGSINTAQLHRALRFKSSAISSVTSNIIGSTTTVFLAVFVGGPEVLALGAVATTASYPIILYQLEKNFLNLQLRLKFTLKDAKDIFSYTKYVLVSSILYELANNLAQLIIGKTHSMSQVGLYNRAVTTGGLLNKLLTEGLSPVISPFFSSINRTGQNLSNPYYILTSIFNHISWSFFVFVFFHANEIITLIFGEQWKSASIFLQIICIDRIIGTFVPMFDSVFLGLGKAKQLMYVNLVLNVLKIGVILFFIEHGIEAMLLAISITVPALGSLVRVYLLVNNKLITYVEIFKVNMQPFFVASIIGVFLFFAQNESNSDIFNLVSNALLCFLIFVVVSLNSELYKLIHKLWEKKA